MTLFAASRKIAGLIRFVMNIKYTGIKNMPKSGAVIVCSNHRSNYDPVLLGACLGHDLYYMAKAELFKIPVLRNLIRAYGAFPVNRGKGDTEALKKSLSILKEGHVLAMFPEGSRLIEGGEPRRFKSGAAMFAYKTHFTVVPVAIYCKGKTRFFKRKRILVGEPLTYEELGFTDGSTENLRGASSLIRDKVIELLKEGERLETK